MKNLTLNFESESCKIKKRKHRGFSVKKILGGILAFLVMGFVGVFMIYPAVNRHIHRIEAPGIDQMEMVKIGGIKQAVYFRGQNVDNPAILFLHGGPGFPEIPTLHAFQFPLEEYFTIVHCDQRNAGKTLFRNDGQAVLETMSFERSLQDAYEVTQHIKEVLDKEEVIVLGYS